MERGRGEGDGQYVHNEQIWQSSRIRQYCVLIVFTESHCQHPHTTSRFKSAGKNIIKLLNISIDALLILILISLAMFRLEMGEMCVAEDRWSSDHIPCPSLSLSFSFAHSIRSWIYIGYCSWKPDPRPPSPSHHDPRKHICAARVNSRCCCFPLPAIICNFATFRTNNLIHSPHKNFKELQEVIIFFTSYI